MAIRVAVLSQRQVVRGLTFGMKQTQSPPEETGCLFQKEKSLGNTILPEL